MAELYNLTMNDDWGGFNDGIENRAATGAEVQKFIKDQLNDKVGFTHVLPKHEVNGKEYHIVLGFASEDEFTSWNNDLNSELILTRADIPVAEPEAGYLIKFQSGMKNQSMMVQGGDIPTILKCRFNLSYYNPADSSTETQSAIGLVSIEKRTTGNFVGVKTDDYSIYKLEDGKKVYVNSFDSVNFDGDEWYYVDVSKALTQGNQDIKISVSTTLDSGDILSTTYTYKINNLGLGISLLTSWWVPMEITKDMNYLNLRYRVNGDTAKKHLKLRISTNDIDANGDAVYVDKSIYLGTDSGEIILSNYQLIKDSNILSHGIHTVEAWLSVTDSIFGTFESDHVLSQILVSNKNDEDYTDKSQIIVNDLVEPIINWTNHNPLFSYAIYNPLKSEVDCQIVFKNIDRDVVFLEKIETVQISNKKEFPIVFTLPSTYTEGVVCEIYCDNELVYEYIFGVENKKEYSPLNGYTFEINPKNRYNSGSDSNDYCKIINNTNNQVIASTWMGFEGIQSNDNYGWIEDDNKLKCLRVLSGQTIDINGYNPFKLWSDNMKGTLEFEIATRNVTNNEVPVIRLGEYVNDSIVGIEIRPTDLMVGDTENTARLTQDVAFNVDTKTHIAIVYNLGEDSYIPQNSQTSKLVNYVNIYVNGCLTRVFTYEPNWFEKINNPIFIIGNEEECCDIDIYNIRFYINTESGALTSDNVMHNYKVSLSTIEEKELYDEINPSEISYTKIKNKYNTLVWVPNKRSASGLGQLPWKGNDSKCYGDLLVDIVGDDKRSGTISNLRAKGQGTSSMEYWMWNVRWEFDKYKEDFKDFSSDIDSTVFTNNLGEISEGCYQLESGMPYAKRLDGKINWASQMQTHKIGSTALYNDLWRKCVGENQFIKEGGTAQGKKFTGTENGYADCRVAIKQLPFYVFVKENPDDTEDSYKFWGLYTMGPSKGDKPTFGYDKKTFADFVMIEGADNNTPIVNYQAPWNDIDVRYVDSDGDIVYQYLESKDDSGDIWKTQWEVAMGRWEAPSADNVGTESDDYFNCHAIGQKFKELNNLIYNCYPHIGYFDGTYTDLVDTYTSTYMKNNNIDSRYLRWVTKGTDGDIGNEPYGLYRYDTYQNTWVHAGAEHTGIDRSSNYEIVNLSNVFADKISGDKNWSKYTAEQKNNKFIEWRISQFKELVNSNNKYIDFNDLKYTMQFLKLIAASDNWAKNTYWYTTSVDEPFRFFQDDLDTIFATNNTGRKTKPYYIEEQDEKYVNAGLIPAMKGQSFWNASLNGLYCLMQDAYAVELQDMMKQILEGCSELSGVTGDLSINKCFDKYYFDTISSQFCTRAFNETSKMYKDAYMASIDPSRPIKYTYSTDTHPLSQITGEAVQGERNWINNRLVYLSSYASYGSEFDKSSTGGAFVFRAPSGGEIKNSLTTSMWLYPKVKIGDTQNDIGRMYTGQTTNLNIGTGGDVTVAIKGLNYLKSLGNLNKVDVKVNTDSLSGSAVASSKAMIDFTAHIESGNAKFNIGGLSFANNPSLKDIKLSTYNKSIVNNISKVELGYVPKLETLDLTGTNIKNVNIPRGLQLKTVLLPSTVTDLYLDNLNRLEVFSLDNYSKLTIVSIKNMTGNSAIDSFEVFKSCYNSKSPLKTFIANDINWTGLTKDQLSYLLDIQNLDISGTIDVGETPIGYDEKMNLLNRFGNIDDPNNDLYVIYSKNPVVHGKVKILGPASIYDVGYTYKYKLDYPGNEGQANDFTNVEWSIDSIDSCEINSKTGELTLNKLGSGNEKVTISCTYKYYNNKGDEQERTVDKVIVLGKVLAKIGDYVYADGSYGNPADDMGHKTIVGICFWVDGSMDINTQKRMAVGVEVIPTTNGVMWGPSVNKDGVSYDVESLHNYLNTYNTSIYPYNNSWYINGDIAKSVIRIPADEDPDYAISDFGWGEKGPRGKHNTELIITHRKSADLTNIEEWKTEGYDSEYLYLEGILSTITDNNTKSWFFPAASYCHAYEPGQLSLKLKDGEILSDKFKYHNWFLPSIGELIHIWYYIMFNTTVDGEYLIGFSNLKNKLNELFVWSSTEGKGYSGGNPRAHALKFVQNNSYWLGGTSNVSGVGSGEKSNNYAVLPVTIF